VRWRGRCSERHASSGRLLYGDDGGDDGDDDDDDDDSNTFEKQYTNYVDAESNLACDQLL